MSNGRNGTLYIGVTSNLNRRIYEHKEGLVDGFTKEYALKNLVWYEECANAENAIKREKAMKKYPRQWKLNLITQMNPEWNDLYEVLSN